MATLGTGGKKETTEWEEILKQKGIIPEKTEEEIRKEQLKELVAETVEAYDPHKNKPVEQLDEELEEADSEEEQILENYRRKRLEEIKANAMKVKYGPGVKYISSSDWKAEVTEALPETFVVVHLFQPSIEACEIIEDRLVTLSAKFRTTKFVKCKASDAIKNYPDEKCPTVLVYNSGKVLKQFVGLKSFSTSLPTTDDVEWALHVIGAVKSDMIEAPNPQTNRFNIRRA